MMKDYVLFYNDEEYTKPIQFHSHDFYEIYFFKDGSVRYYVEDEDYEMKKGNVLIIPPGKLHRPVIERGMRYTRYVLWIYESFVKSNEGIGSLIDDISRLIEEKNTRLIFLDEEEKHKVWEKLDELISCDNKTTENDGNINTIIARYVGESQVILTLYDIRNRLLEADITETTSGDLVKDVISFLNETYCHTPSLEELAQRFCVSKYYLCHCFKEYTKTTIHSYIQMKKINKAKELLKSGTLPQQVSEDCGFSTYSNFYKAFVGETGKSPREYRSV